MPFLVYHHKTGSVISIAVFLVIVDTHRSITDDGETWVELHKQKSIIGV